MMKNPHPESKWTHPICTDCYEREEPDRIPATMFPPNEEICCFCGVRTDNGAYYRKDPKIVHA